MERIDVNSIFCTDGTLKLLTGYTEREFVKANLTQFIEETGYLVHAGPSFDQKASAAWTFDKWQYDSTTLTEGQVEIYGSEFEGQFLAEVLNSVQSDDKNEKAAAWKKLRLLVHIYKEAHARQIQLPEGALCGIIINDNNQVLFLPPTILERTLRKRSDLFYSRYMGCWTQSNYTYDQNTFFSLCTYLYKALTGDSPYPELNTEKRTSDYYDDNFIPIKYTLALKPGFAEMIDTNLTYRIPKKATKNKKEKHQASQSIAEQFDSLAAALPENIEELFLSASLRVELESKRLEFAKQQQKTLRRTRFIRKNQTTVTLTAVALMVFAFFLASFINDKIHAPNTKGLTAQEVIQSYYSAFSHLDSETMSLCVKRGVARPHSDLVSTMFVTSRVRQAYEGIQNPLTPAQWLTSKTPEKDIVFGLSNFNINGTGANSSFKRPEPPQLQIISKENSTKPTVPRDAQKFIVEYYLIMCTGNEQFSVNKYTDTLTLTFNKKIWRITQLTSDVDDIQTDPKAFFASLKAGTANATDYPWLPTADECEAGKLELSEPYKF